MIDLTLSGADPQLAAAESARRVVRPIPLRRLIGVELRKMFDTRSGFWLLVSIGLLSAAATVAVVVFAPDSELTYVTFASAIGFPMSVILPMIAILAVTSEWSQRSGLTTFALVPRRGRVIGAKAVATLVVGVLSMVIAGAFGALGNVAGSTIAGIDPVWNIGLADAGQIILGNVLGMTLGFTLGVVLRNSPAALVGYFVVSLVLPGILELLALVREWFADLQPWIDFDTTQATLLASRTSSAQEWAQLGSTTLLWIVLPLLVGLMSLRRSDVK